MLITFNFTYFFVVFYLSVNFILAPGGSAHDRERADPPTQNYIAAQIRNQWVTFHLHHPDNKQYVNQTAGMRQCRKEGPYQDRPPLCPFRL